MSADLARLQELVEVLDFDKMVEDGSDEFSLKFPLLPCGVKRGVLHGLYNKQGKASVSLGVVKEKSKMQKHVHDEKEFFIVIHGEMEVRENGKKTILKRGDSYYINPGVPHSVKFNEFTELIVITIPDGKGFPDGRY